MVNVEVKTQAFRGEIGAFLFNVGADFLLESGEQEVTGGVVFDGLVAGIREAAFEHAFRGGLAALALLGEGSGKLVLVVFGEGEAHFINFLYRKFQREAIGVLELEEIGAGDFAGGASEFLEFFDALGDGLAEGVFFGGEDGEDLGAVGQDVVGEGLVVFGDDGEDFGEELLADAKVKGFQNGAADEAAEGVALGFVGGREALGGKQVGAAEVVSDDAHLVGVVVVVFVGDFF